MHCIAVLEYTRALSWHDGLWCRCVQDDHHNYAAQGVQVQQRLRHNARQDAAIHHTRTWKYNSIFDGLMNALKVNGTSVSMVKGANFVACKTGSSV